MADGPSMRYVGVDLDWRQGRIRIGACVFWAIAIIVVACTGHLLLGLPATLPSIWKWFRP